MFDVRIDMENKTVSDSKGYYEVVDYSSVFGYNLSMQSFINYQDGKRISPNQERIINDIYTKLFVKDGSND